MALRVIVKNYMNQVVNGRSITTATWIGNKKCLQLQIVNEQGTVKRADNFISLELSLVPEKEFYVLSWLVQSFRYGPFCILQKNITQFIFRKTSKCYSISKDWIRGSVILSKPPIFLKMFVLEETIFESLCLEMSRAQTIIRCSGTAHGKRHKKNATEQTGRRG